VNERNLIPFRPGMSASVDIQTRRVNKVISIPIQAVTTRNKDSVDVKQDGDERRRVQVKNENEEKESASLKKEVKIKEYVFVLDKEKISQVEVKTGIQDNDYIEIISGIKEEDVIICGPYSAVSKSLTEKTKVKVVKKEDLYKTDK
jgi:HlyD family secretion protein